MLEYAYFGPANPETDYDAKVFGQADRSIALARDNAFAYQVKCYCYLIVSRRPEEALRAAEAALAINPNSPSAHMARANAEILSAQQAKSDVQQAMRLSPRDPNLANGTTSWLTLNSVSGISTP